MTGKIHRVRVGADTVSPLTKLRIGALLQLAQQVGADDHHIAQALHQLKKNPDLANFRYLKKWLVVVSRDIPEAALKSNYTARQILRMTGKSQSLGVDDVVKDEKTWQTLGQTNGRDERKEDDLLKGAWGQQQGIPEWVLKKFNLKDLLNTVGDSQMTGADDHLKNEAFWKDYFSDPRNKGNIQFFMRWGSGQPPKQNKNRAPKDVGMGTKEAEQKNVERALKKKKKKRRRFITLIDQTGKKARYRITFQTKAIDLFGKEYLITFYNKDGKELYLITGEDGQISAMMNGFVVEHIGTSVKGLPIIAPIIGRKKPTPVVYDESTADN